MKLGRWRVDRVRPAGVEAVEVWNWPTDEGPLWELVGAPRVETLRSAGRPESEIASLLARTLAPAIVAMAGHFGTAQVHLGGGLTEIPGFRQELARRTSLPLSFAAEGQWLHEAGGLALLEERGNGNGAILDVGQTSIKGLAGGRRMAWPRDLSILPRRFILEDGTSQGAPTEPAAAFIAGALIDLLRGVDRANRALILSLPCPLDDDCVLGPCTYGWQGDGELLPRIFAMVDERLHPWPGAEPLVLVLNDAELFAESTRRELRPTPSSATLCVTLGFGPGGAVLKT